MGTEEEGKEGRDKEGDPSSSPGSHTARSARSGKCPVLPSLGFPECEEMLGFDKLFLVQAEPQHPRLPAPP